MRKTDKLQKEVFKLIKEIFNIYSLTEKLSFCLNSLQSVISQFVLGIFSWYIFDILFTGKGSKASIIFSLFFAILYFVILIPLFGYLMERGQSKIKKNISNIIINRFFSCTPISVNKIHSSYIIEILQGDINKVSEFGSWQTVVLLQAIISGVVAILSIGLINFFMLIVLFIIGIIPIFFDIIYAKKNKKLLTEARFLYDEKAKTVLNTLDNHIIYSFYNKIDKSVEDMFLKHNKMAKIQEKVSLNSNILNFVHNFIYNILYRVFILTIGLYLFLIDKISIGEIGFILSMSEGLSFFFSSTGAYIRNIQELIISKNRIEHFLNFELLNTYEDKINDEKIDSIEFKNIYFKYPESENYIFKDLNFKFIMGKRYLLIGENGQGKSTLLKLIFGIYEPINGDILINNNKVNGFQNRKISYVPQEPKLFSGTVSENIITENSNATIKDIKNVLKIVKLDKTFDENSVIYENGSNFSKGQLIRIVLCRALLQKPDILMLDEIDANINEEILNDIIESIVKNNPEICIIAISHNKNYDIYKNFVKIIMKNKCINEMI